MSAPRVMKLHVEGWRRINHSYALVNRNHLRWLLKDPRLSITHREMPYFKAHWAANPNHSFPAAFEAVLNLPDQDAPPDVDITLRMDFPHRFDKPARGKLVVFGTTEYTHISPENLRGDVAAAASDPEVFILTPSQWSAQGFLKLGFPQERVWVLPHGVDKEHFRITTLEEKARYRALLGIDQHAKVFLHVGGGWFGKGLDLLIEAFSIHAKSHPHSRLVIKGHDALYGNAVLNAFANRPLSLPPGVELAREQILYLGGDLSDESMDHLYRLADCYVATYRGEGFNMPLLEAAARGLQIIATKGGAADEFLGHFTNICLLDAKLTRLPNGDEYLNVDRTLLVRALQYFDATRQNRDPIAHHRLKTAENSLSWDRVSNKITGKLTSAASITRLNQTWYPPNKSQISKLTLVLVHIGKTKPPSYLFDALSENLKLTKWQKIYLIIEDKTDALYCKHDNVLNQSVELVQRADLKESAQHEEYKNNNMLARTGDQFWTSTTERFFLIDALIKQKNLKHVIHTESDVVLYQNISYLEKMCIDLPKIRFTLDSERGFGTIVYISEIRASEIICMEIVRHPTLNDMQILGRLYLNNTAYCEPLPTASVEMLKPGTKETTRYCNETDPYIYDAAALGQFIDGTDPIHNKFQDNRGFQNEATPLDFTNFLLTWLREGGALRPYVITEKATLPVANLHLHSKRLSKFPITTESKKAKTNPLHNIVKVIVNQEMAESGSIEDLGSDIKLKVKIHSLGIKDATNEFITTTLTGLGTLLRERKEIMIFQSNIAIVNSISETIARHLQYPAIAYHDIAMSSLGGDPTHEQLKNTHSLAEIYTNSISEAKQASFLHNVVLNYECYNNYCLNPIRKAYTKKDFVIIDCRSNDFDSSVNREWTSNFSIIKFSQVSEERRHRIFQAAVAAIVEVNTSSDLLIDLARFQIKLITYDDVSAFSPMRAFSVANCSDFHEIGKFLADPYYENSAELIESAFVSHVMEIRGRILGIYS